LAFGNQKPVITTNVGGLAEVVEDGRTGLVVPPEDPAALAAAVIRYFDEDLGPEFTDNIRDSASRFSWDQLVKQLLTLTQEST
jgi:glycosyltransferase involved in cell wall biosynthesis